MLSDFEVMIGEWRVTVFTDDRGEGLRLQHEGSMETITFFYEKLDEPVFEDIEGEGSRLTLRAEAYGLVVNLPEGDDVKPFVELIEAEGGETLAMMEVPRDVASAVFLLARDQMPSEQAAESASSDPSVEEEPSGGRKKRRRTFRKKKKGTTRRRVAH